MRRLTSATGIARSVRRVGGRVLLGGTLAVIGAVLMIPASGAIAQTEDGRTGDAGFVNVVEVSGLLDPVLVRFIEDAVADGADQGARWVVLQVNSTGAVVEDEQVVELARLLADPPVPVAAWIGPSGANATGAVAQVVGVLTEVGISPGSRFGDLGEPIVPDELLAPDLAAVAGDLVTVDVGAARAVGLGIARAAPTLGDFVIGLEGFEVRIDDSGDEPRSVPVTQVRFGQLSLIDQLFHTVASPPVAYLLLLVGLGLLVFELYTAGVGIAGVIGAVAVIGAGYGLDVLPARGWAVGLLVFAAFGFAVDVQVGVPRVWTGIAILSLVAGSVFLYDGVGMSWLALLAGILGMVLAMVAGMPAMVRTRFSTPTIGREWMVGEMGDAVEAVAPEGLVRIRDALWRARTNRATPIDAGDRVRVVSIEGLILEVEPEEGGARDYRERRR